MKLYKWLKNKYMLWRGIGSALILNGEIYKLRYDYDAGQIIIDVPRSGIRPDYIDNFLIDRAAVKVHKITIEWRKGK